MSSCATQTFDNVTPEKWALLVSKANASGLNIQNDSGSASQDGFTFTWDYDPNAQSLAIQCTAKPFFVSCSTVNGKVHEMFDDVVG
jgi:hypothetical protein